MTKQSAYTESHTELGIAEELRDKEFRDQFFRTERELDIPAQIKALRRLRGLSQEELAQLIGTKQSGISRLERSTQAKWNLETLVKISEALDARLAVIIEPYELVVGRYRTEEKARERSAATAQIADAPLRDMPKEAAPQNQQKLPNVGLDRGVGVAQWN